MKNKFLLVWNDEYLDMDIISGPFEDSECEQHLKSELIKQLMQNTGHSLEESEQIYKNKRQGLPTFKDIDLNISPDFKGASLVYGTGYECRLQVIEYGMNPELIVPTPKGNLRAKLVPDEEYPAIAILLDYPGEPGVDVEYNSAKKCFICRVYTIQHPDDEPDMIIKFEENSA